MKKQILNFLRTHFCLSAANLSADMQQALSLKNADEIGAYVATFETEFAKNCGVKFAMGVNSGTSALYFALRALDIGPGDEVITTANTYIATINAIRETGATCKFVDIDIKTGLLDVGSLEAAFTAKTRAVVPVHMYGHPAPIRDIQVLCQKYHLALVEDACQAIGTEIDGRTAGTLGQMGCFSFHVNKLVGAPADGGMIVTNDRTLSTKLRLLTHISWHAALESPQCRMPCRLPALAIPILREKLRALPEVIANRQAQALAYEAIIGELTNSWLLKPPSGGTPSFRSIILVSEKIDQCRHVLSKNKWPAGPMYSHSVDFLGGLEKAGIDLPKTAYFLRHHLVLPSGNLVSLTEIEKIARALKNAMT